MSTRSQLTKDLNDSVKLLLGKQVKILFKNVVRLETKGDKTENRVLVFSPCRMLLLTAKVPTRIDCHFHYLEIQAVESKRGNQLSVTINDKVYSFLTGDDSTCSLEVDTMVSALATAIRNIFPTVPLQYIIRRLDVIPASRLQLIRDLETGSSSTREAGPCGGFSTQYACMCDYHNMPYREEVAWDVDNIYLTLNTRELSLKDFDHLDQKDLIPIISALEYNTWFTKFKASHVRLSHETIERVLHVMRRSLSLEELYLDNLGLKADFVNKLSNAVKTNNATQLHTIDLSHNLIEDKGAINLIGCISKLPKGLVHLNLAHCGLTSKSINQIAQCLSNNNNMYSTLTYLNICGNNLKDEINSLYNFLAQPNAITHLDISSTDTMLESLFGALLRGCATNLVHLNVSKNPFSSKKSKEAPLSFKQFFTSTLNLKYLNMSFCKLPQEALKNLLLGLACNESTVEMALDLSTNALGTQGAHVLESCIHGVRCISSLDISDNNMDVELASVILAVSKNKSLKHLIMGRNTQNMKAKNISAIMDSLVQIIQDEDCILQSLYIPDSKLKSDLHNLLNALGDNKCLETIDISGNFIGDSGARLLAKALQINSKLKTIIYDRNNITLQGYNDIAYALESNRTVQYMPFPIYDVAPCMKTNAEKTDAVMRRMQELLNRNVAPKKFTRACLLQPGFLLSSKQQLVDRLVVQIQDSMKSIAQEPVNLDLESNNDYNLASGVIEDADNSKQLLMSLQELVCHKGSDGHPIEAKLQHMAAELHNDVEDYLANTTEKMLKNCKDLCPHVLSDSQVVQDIRKGCKSKNHIPFNLISNCISQAGIDVIDKINELNLSVALHMSEQVTDEVQESLMKSYKILVGEEPRGRGHSPPSRSRLSSSDSSRHGASDVSITDSSHQSDHSPLATPHLSIKRKSLHGRKLRPKSVVDSVEGLSADDIPSLMPQQKHGSEEEDSVTELPNATHQLHHLVKGRPRRAKTRAPTRPLLRPGEVTDAITQDLGEGLDSFFRPGSVTPTGSDDCSFQADGSPNRDISNFTSPILNNKLSRNAPYLRGQCGMLSPAPRSRSSDNLERYSPCPSRHSETPSPLARRFISESNSPIDPNIPDDSSPHSDSSSVTDGGKSGGDQTPGSTSKSKVAPPPVAPKPRPWSMVNSDGKTGDMNLLSTSATSPGGGERGSGGSSTHTPDSGDGADSDASSLERNKHKENK